MFFHFRQNNSGGHFHIDPDAGISVNVIIEAASAREANDKAEDLGLYFNGVNRYRDCACCGDRWYPAENYEGKDVPSLYDRPVHDEVAVVGTKWAEDSPEGFIHYADGRMEAIWAGDGDGWSYSAVVSPWPLVEAQVIEAIAA